ncbi:VENN motif pre-toxin domain-containing protein [Testudinibacter sp. P80/BLE/0925]|uniref:VENN motif pre-toxin domain-containing protein n=1 Tax=Testudinibacter sp. TW-1 TaxID=3417757 RepID=UPI003D364E42
MAQTLYGKKASDLNEREKQNITALSSLTGALAAGMASNATNGTTNLADTLANAAIGQATAESAVENNALLNRQGESYLRSEKDKALVELLKENGVKSTEDFTEAYLACITDSCRQQIEVLNSQATSEGLEIIKQLAENEIISRNDYTDIISTILPKMAEGALVSGREVGAESRLYKNDVSEVVGHYAGGGDSDIYRIFDEKSLRDLGYDGVGLDNKLKDTEHWGNAWESGVVIGRGVNSPISSTNTKDKDFKIATEYLKDLPVTGVVNNYQPLKLGEKAKIDGVEHIRVGRWMSKYELERIQKDQKMISGAGGQTFISLNGASDFRGAAPKGSVYVEFNLPTNSLIQGGKEGWFKTISEEALSSQKFRLMKQGGELSPKINNIKILDEK